MHNVELSDEILGYGGEHVPRTEGHVGREPGGRWALGEGDVEAGEGDGWREGTCEGEKPDAGSVMDESKECVEKKGERRKFGDAPAACGHVRDAHVARWRGNRRV